MGFDFSAIQSCKFQIIQNNKKNQVEKGWPNKNNSYETFKSFNCWVCQSQF